MLTEMVVAREVTSEIRSDIACFSAADCLGAFAWARTVGHSPVAHVFNRPVGLITAIADQ